MLLNQIKIDLSNNVFYLSLSHNGIRKYSLSNGAQLAQIATGNLHAIALDLRNNSQLIYYALNESGSTSDSVRVKNINDPIDVYRTVFDFIRCLFTICVYEFVGVFQDVVGLITIHAYDSIGHYSIYMSL